MLNAPQRRETQLRGRWSSDRTTVSPSSARASGLPRWWADAVAVVVATLIIGGPLIFTRNGFAADFTDHLWLVWVQSKAISQHGLPTYFVNAPPVGVFYPFFEFYGGTLYATTGGLAALLGGHVVLAFVAVTLLAIAASYGGLLWLARQLGVRGWMAHAPAITYTASAYYVTNLYGRGAWTEVIATSAIPLLVASGWKLARAPRIELLPAVLFVVSAVFFSGSHNITLVLGTVVLVGGLILLWLALGWGALIVPLRRVLALGALLVLAVAVNAWFLLPDTVHAGNTKIGVAPLYPWSFSKFFNTPAILFNPLRAVPGNSGNPGLYVQAPDWFLVWALAVGGLLWSRSRPALRRAACAVTVAMLAILALIMIGPLWDHMPRTFREVQLPYRLNTYVALCSAALVLIGCLAVQRGEPIRRRRALSLGLMGAAAVSIGLCAWQLWVANPDQPWSYRNRDQVFVSTHVTPKTWYDTGNYADFQEPLVSNTKGLLVVPAAAVGSDHVTLTVTPPAGSQPFITNIGAGTYAARLSGGLVRVGRTGTGFVVARRADSSSGPVTLKLGPAGGAVAVGEVLSLIAIVVLLLALAIGMSGVIDRFLRSREKARAKPSSGELG